MPSPAHPGSPPVGADIESLCGRCGDVWHVVVAKVGDSIARVQCKQCGGLHRHRPPVPRGETAGAVRRTREAASPNRAAGRKDARTGSAPAPVLAPQPDLSRPVRPYRATEAFTAGDRLQHPTFGLGVVAGSPGPGKIQVAFPDGLRILAQAKAPPAIDRPIRRPHEDDEDGSSENG